MYGIFFGLIIIWNNYIFCIVKYKDNYFIKNYETMVNFLQINID